MSGPPPDRRVRCWNRQAATYDARMTRMERRFFSRSRGWVCGRADGAVLEVAIGTGANLSHYPASATVTGVDWSEAMLQRAADRAARLGRPVELQLADARDLPFAAASFDAVVCTFGLCCIPDHRAALTEALRVLRPGGDLLLADHVAATFPPLRALQHVVDLVSVPLQGEHFTRRPLPLVRTLGAEVVHSERSLLGAIEHVHARRAGVPPSGGSVLH